MEDYRSLNCGWQHVFDSCSASKDCDHAIMNEFHKATAQSVIRHVMQALAGIWVAKNPDLSGAIEAGIVSLLAIIWTYIDNKKNPPTGPEKVTVTLG